MNDKEKNEIRLLGGEFDGLIMDVNDRTMAWPFSISLEMMIDDGLTPHGADHIPDNVMKTKIFKYTVLDHWQSGNGDAYSQYTFDQSEDRSYDLNNYSTEPPDPFAPEG